MNTATPLDLGSITPLDTGFDLRVHRMIVELRRAPLVSVTYDKRGKSLVASGAPEAVGRILRSAGYRVRWV